MPVDEKALALKENIELLKPFTVNSILKLTSTLFKAVLCVVFIIGTTHLCAQTSLEIKDQVASYEALDSRTVTVTGKSELHLTGAADVLTNSQVSLNSEGAWLYFDNIKPSVVIETYLGLVKVNGADAVSNTNVRIRNYGMGTLIIPHTPSYQALEVYAAKDFGGASMKMNSFTFYRSEEIEDDASIDFEVVTIGGFNNSIESFKLKRGYMATFAQSKDGTGYSKVYIADKEDLEISSMPEGLTGRISFVRVLPWNYPSKKGFTYASGANQLNASWFYNWGGGASSTDNVEFVPMKWGGGYAGVNYANKTDATHVLGFNEPSHKEQSNVSVDDAIRYWSSLQKSGLRLGSPGIADNGKPWLYKFMAKADKLNLRVDFCAVHFYQGGRTAKQMYNWLKDVYKKTGRPVWVTEWNNGAPWTKYAPTPTYEEQAKKIKAFISMMDTTSWIERYAVYNWVGKTRAVILNKAPTLAGEEYRDKVSPLAFNPDKEFHQKYMGLTKPYGAKGVSKEDGVHLKWDENVAEDEGVIIERSFNGGEFSEIVKLEGVEISSYIDETADEPGAYRYRVKYFNSEKETDFSNVALVKVSIPGSVNVAVSKPVTVDSFSEEKYSGQGAVDSDARANKASRWISNGETEFPHWIEIDLKGTYNIFWLSFYTGDKGYNKPISDFEFMYWDIETEEWRTALSVTENSSAVYHNGFEPVLTNKVKLNVTKASDNFVRLYEIEVFGAEHKKPIPENLALNKAVQTSSTHAKGKNPGELAVDGKSNTQWVTASEEVPEWIEIDLGASYVINRMKLAIGKKKKEGYFKEFDFQYWDGEKWVEIFKKEGNTNKTYEHAFDEVTTQKVRLNITAKSTAVRLQEIQVYGYDPNFTMDVNHSVVNKQIYRVYPTFTSGQISIEGLSLERNVAVYSAQGKLVLTKKTNRELNVEQLENGVYLLKIDQKNTLRFVKQ